MVVSVAKNLHQPCTRPIVFSQGINRSPSVIHRLLYQVFSHVFRAGQPESEPVDIARVRTDKFLVQFTIVDGIPFRLTIRISAPDATPIP